MAKTEKTAAPALKRDVRCNTDTGLLKLIAIVTMLVDHLGARVFPEYHIMRVIGRIAFPIFAYCIAMGCCYTRSMLKYALRVLALAVVSQPIYTTAMGHQTMRAFDWAHNYYRIDLIFRHYYLVHPCILFALFLGILIIWSLKEKKYAATAALLALVWYIQSYLDYGLYGIYLMIMFWALIDRPAVSVLWVGAYMIWYGVPALRSKFDVTGVINAFPDIKVYTQFWALLALPIIYIPTHSNIKINKYVFYAFYPAHLILIYLLTMGKAA
ncbi:MAG: hypothetical protein IJJ23_10640 [Clostridia bacterium]|nr:hypothetical protein [Clostridia bacterium]